MFDVLPFFVIGMLIPVVLIGSFKLGKAIAYKITDSWWYERRRLQGAPSFVTPVKVDPDKLDIFCGACGKSYQTVRVQSGFDRKAGAPSYEFKLRCPDWRSKPASGFVAAGAFGWFQGFETRDCDAIKRSETVGAHNHPDGAETMTCPSCIDDAFKNGVIDEKTVRRLYVEAGVQ